MGDAVALGTFGSTGGDPNAAVPSAWAGGSGCGLDPESAASGRVWFVVRSLGSSTCGQGQGHGHGHGFFFGFGQRGEAAMVPPSTVITQPVVLGASASA